MLQENVMLLMPVLSFSGICHFPEEANSTYQAPATTILEQLPYSEASFADGHMDPPQEAAEQDTCG